jgi:hypothetical protein
VDKNYRHEWDDEITLEIPSYRRKAQEVLHQMVGADIDPEDYVRFLEMIENALNTAFQEGYQWRQVLQEIRDEVRTPKRRRTDPGVSDT